MRIGLTGTQVGMNEQQLDALWVMLQEMEVSEFHHGDCIGADEQAHSIARRLGIKIIIHPPDISDKRAFCIGYMRQISRKPYLERNQCIVDMTEQLIAAPASNIEQVRSGTWYTVRYARRNHKQVHLLER